MKSVTMLLCGIVLAGCTTVPNRFSRDTNLNCGYTIEHQTEKGFALEVFYMAYSFLPNPDAAVQQARACFTRTAVELAKRNGKNITPITSADMHANATRNILDGRYSVYVTGTVVYE